MVSGYEGLGACEGGPRCLKVERACLRKGEAAAGGGTDGCWVEGGMKMLQEVGVLGGRKGLQVK